MRGFLKTPGSIHLDSDATGGDCGSGPNQQLIQGKHVDGVVAFGSPTAAGHVRSPHVRRDSPRPTSNIVYDSLDTVAATIAIARVDLGGGRRWLLRDAETASIS